MASFKAMKTTEPKIIIAHSAFARGRMTRLSFQSFSPWPATGNSSTQR